MSPVEWLEQDYDTSLRLRGQVSRDADFVTEHYGPVDRPSPQSVVRQPMFQIKHDLAPCLTGTCFHCRLGRLQEKRAA